MAMRIGSQAANHRWSASAMVRSPPSSTISPPAVSKGHKQLRTCRQDLDPSDPSSPSAAPCYRHLQLLHVIIAHGPILLSWAARGRKYLQTPKGYCVGDRPSHLIFRDVDTLPLFDNTLKRL